MSDSKIEWTGKTWNPTTGCDVVSRGCFGCYARTMAARLKAMGQDKYAADGDPRTSGPGFGITAHPDELDRPFGWHDEIVFVDSMSDLLHAGVARDFVARVFAVMALTPTNIYQLLTKRHGRLFALLGRSDSTFFDEVLVAATEIAEERGITKPGEVLVLSWPLPNVWVGVSVEDQDAARLRIGPLASCLAAVKFLSVEPMVGPVDLEPWLWRDVPISEVSGQALNDAPGAERFVERTGAIGWVIVGGESGRLHPLRPDGSERPQAERRPAELDLGWVRDLRDQCAAAGVPLFVKQLGTVAARRLGAKGKGGDPEQWPADLRVRQVPVPVEGSAYRLVPA